MHPSTRLFHGIRFEVWIVLKFGFELYINIHRVFHGNCQKWYAYERALKYKIWAGTGVFYFNEIGPFWDLVLKKIHDHSVIIHLRRLWRFIFVEICKIHLKLRIKKRQYCFAYILSAWALNAHSHILSWVRTFTTHAHAFVHGSGALANRLWPSIL